MTGKKGGGAQAKTRKLLIKPTRAAYAKVGIELAEYLIDNSINSKITKMDETILARFAEKLNASKKGGLGIFYRFLQRKDVLSVNLKGFGEKVFGESKPRADIGLTGEGVGMQASQAKGGGGLDIKMGKAGGVRKQVDWSDTQSTSGDIGKRTTKTVMQKVLGLVKKAKHKVIAATGKKYDILFFAKSFKKDGRKFVYDKNGNKVPENVSISNNTVRSLSNAIFGDDKVKVNAKNFRKGFSTYVYNKYGATSDQFALVDEFGLGHKKVTLTDTQASYVAGLKSKGGAPVGKAKKDFKELQNEYQGLIFDGKTSKQLENMTDAQLEKYFLSKDNLEEPEGISIYRLKKGFEKIELLKRASDKDGFIAFNAKGDLITDPKQLNYDIKIHEDVLEGMYRAFSEGSARVTEQFAKAGNLEKVPVSGAPKAIMPEAINSLINKLNLDKVSGGKGLINLNIDEKLKPLDVDPYGKASLSKNSEDNLKTLQAKVKILMVGGKSGNISRKALGKVKYEKNLKALLKSAGMTDSDIKNMKRISLTDKSVDIGVLSRLAKKLDCN